MNGSGGFIFLLIMAVVILLSRMIQNAARRETQVPEPAQRSDEQPLRDEAADVMPAQAPAPRPKSRPASRSDRTPGRRGPGPSPTARVTARQMVAGRENLRRAVIVMTVLGPPVSERPPSSQ